MEKNEIIKFLDDDSLFSIIYYDKGMKKVSNSVENIDYKEDTNELLFSTMDEKNILINLENIVSFDYNFYSDKK